MTREELRCAWHALRRHADRARCLDGETGRAVIRGALGTLTDPENVARALEARGALRRALPEDVGDVEVWMVATAALFEEARGVFGDDNCNERDEVAA